MPKFKVTVTVIVTCDEVVEADDHNTAFDMLQHRDVSEWLRHDNGGPYLDSYEVKAFASDDCQMGCACPLHEEGMRRAHEDLLREAQQERTPRFDIAIGPDVTIYQCCACKMPFKDKNYAVNHECVQTSKGYSHE